MKMRESVDVLEKVQSLATPGTSIEPPTVPTPVVLVATHDISAGSVLIKSDAILPHSMRIAFKRYGSWTLATETNGVGFERMLSEAGWHFFFIVPEIRVGAVSSNRNNAVRAALNKALAAVESQNLNALEIVNVSSRRILGLHHVKFVVHPRHVIQRPYLRTVDPYHVSRNVWDGKGVLERRAQFGPIREGI
jgi:hypothetical protein